MVISPMRKPGTYFFSCALVSDEGPGLTLASLLYQGAPAICLNLYLLDNIFTEITPSL